MMHHRRPDQRRVRHLCASPRLSRGLRRERRARCLTGTMRCTCLRAVCARVAWARRGFGAHPSCVLRSMSPLSIGGESESSLDAGEEESIGQAVLARLLARRRATKTAAPPRSILRRTAHPPVPGVSPSVARTWPPRQDPSSPATVHPPSLPVGGQAATGGRPEGDGASCSQPALAGDGARGSHASRAAVPAAPVNRAAGVKLRPMRPSKGVDSTAASSRATDNVDVGASNAAVGAAADDNGDAAQGTVVGPVCGDDDSDIDMQPDSALEPASVDVLGRSGHSASGTRSVAKAGSASQSSPPRAEATPPTPTPAQDVAASHVASADFGVATAAVPSPATGGMQTAGSGAASAAAPAAAAAAVSTPAVTGTAAGRDTTVAVPASVAGGGQASRSVDSWTPTNPSAGSVDAQLGNPTPSSAAGHASRSTPACPLGTFPGASACCDAAVCVLTGLCALAVILVDHDAPFSKDEIHTLFDALLDYGCVVPLQLCSNGRIGHRLTLAWQWAGTSVGT